MSVQQVCLGWHWTPYQYGRVTDDGTPVKLLPEWLVRLGSRAVTEAYGVAAEEEYHPDVALINYYAGAAKLGMHQDKDEQSAAPVVSLSLGDSCVFRLGNTENRHGPYTDVVLASGDLFVFGGPSRMAYHGVPQMFPGSCEQDIGLEAGRFSITLRVTGMGAMRGRK